MRINKPVCKKCGGDVFYVVPQIQYIPVLAIETDKKRNVSNVELSDLEHSYDDGESYFYCEGCDEEIKVSDMEEGGE